MKKGWEIKKLKEVGNIFNGNSINATVKKQKYSGLDKGMPYVATKDISFDSVINYNNNVLIPFNEVGSFRVADKGSILICAEGGSAGRKIGILNQKVCFVNKLFALSPTNCVVGKYVFYWYKSDFFQFQFKDNLAGLIGGVSKSKFQNLPIPIPPIDEQKEIVAILDKAFTAIEQAKANIEQNIQNAKELFQSKLNQIFSQRGDGWEEKTLGEVGKISMCKRILKKQTTPNGEIPFYKIGTFGKEPNAFISKQIYDDFKSKYSFPKKGDILLSASGTIGRRVIYDGEPAYFQDSNIVWINNNEKLVTNEYLYQFYGVCHFNPSKGATISRLYNDDLRKIKISFPSIEEQKVIIPKMIKLSNQTLQIESNYQQKLTNLEELKKSLLQKAFNGELTMSANSVL